MMHDGLVSPFPLSGRRAKRKRADETLGVFSDGRDWKLYSQFGAAAAYPSREEAMIAAEERVFAAARAGRRVELFVQREDGSLGQEHLDLH